MLCINDIQHNSTLHYAERHYAECCDYSNVMLCVIMLSVVMLNVVMLSVVAPLRLQGWGQFASLQILYVCFSERARCKTLLPRQALS